MAAKRQSFLFLYFFKYVGGIFFNLLVLMVLNSCGGPEFAFKDNTFLLRYCFEIITNN